MTNKSRQPTAWDTAWTGTPSWETGRPQPAVERLVAAGGVAGAVLDAGCGSGRHAVMLAAAGHRVTGIDVAPAAIELARARAAGARVAAVFVTLDAFDLPAAATTIGAPFDTVLDVGLLHVLQPHDRAAYATALGAVTRPGGRALIIAWSERNPFGYGPGRLSRRDLRRTFTRATGWRVDGIAHEVLDTSLGDGRAHAWLVRATRR